MLDRATRLGRALMAIGARPSDRPEERQRKAALVLSALLIASLATFWTGTFLFMGRPSSAAVPFAYQVISVIGLAHLARTGNFAPFRVSQLTAMLILPFVLQWTLGGFVNSSAMMIWAFTSPLAALVLVGRRQAALYFAGYVVLTAVSGVLDPAMAAAAVPVAPELRLLFFVLNIGAVSLVVYAVLQFSVDARERAAAETDALLNNVLPLEIADRLKAGATQIADDFAEVTVLFADVVGFTTFARARPASEVVALLERLFSEFDALADQHGLEKIKTIGDAYMAVAGAPRPMAGHVRAAAEMALGMVAAAARVARDTGHDLQLRVGLHTGQANAGVIGTRKFFYDVWGDAVNVAARMESTGLPGRVQVSAAVASALRDEYLFEERGAIDVKGVGEMATFFLVGAKG